MEEKYNLPNEIEMGILMWLSADDLWNMLQVCKAESSLVKDIYKLQRSRECYQSQFRASGLWAYLPQIAQDGLLTPYFTAFLPAKWLEKVPLKDRKDLSSLRPHLRPKFLNDLQPNTDSQIISSELRSLIAQLQQQSIQEFLALPCSTPAILQERVTVARTYRHVEATFNLLLLYRLIEHSSAEGAVYFVANGLLSRCLTGEGLHLLHWCSAEKKLLGYLVEWSLGEDSRLPYPTKERADLQKNAIIILSRLTDDDYRTFLDAFPDQYAVLLDAIERNCLPIINGLGKRAIASLLQKTTNEAILLILLDRLGAERISLGLTGPGMSKRFKEIVASDSCKNFMAQLLAGLTIEQLCEMIKPISSDPFCCLINSEVFLSFLHQLYLRFQRNEFKDIDPDTLPGRQSSISWEHLSIKITCRSSELLVALSIPNVIGYAYLRRDIRTSEARAYLTDEDFEFLGGQSKVTPTSSVGQSFSTEKTGGWLYPLYLKASGFPMDQKVFSSSASSQTYSNTESNVQKPAWFPWLIAGLLLLATMGILVSILGLSNVHFAVTFCETFINAFIACSPETAAWVMFAISSMLAVTTGFSALIKYYCCREAPDNQEDAPCGCLPTAVRDMLSNMGGYNSVVSQPHRVCQQFCVNGQRIA